ncbi:MAG: 2-dehydropantoate 2-reductase [Candidatus Binatia bacterium]|nr:2-dehydropantoate 2-reductase [Candidatus Binatia bacterium]
MRIIVLGAGGVGSVVAGYLARAGYDVVMLARPGHAAEVQRSGLQLRGLADFRVRLPAFADATRLEAADVLIVTVKTKDMERALQGVAHLQIGCAASLQNGVVKNEQLARVFGWEKVVGATTMIGAVLVRDGEVEYTLDGITFFGELDGRQSERVQWLVDAFVRAGLKAAVADDIVAVEWTKQAFQNPFAPLSALTRLPVHRVWAHPHLAALSVHMFREVVAVARARGVELSKHPAWSLFNIAVWRDAPFEEAVRMIVEVGERVAASGRTHIIPSMLQDVLAGKQTEIEETVGYVYKEGLRLGVPVPYTEFAYRAVKAIEETYDGRIR